MALNAAFGWWWADPVAALGMTYFLVREGREAWKGVDTCRGCADEDRLKESANQVRSLTYDFYEAKPRRSRERAA
jgi:divalent metal cation (Fe/Co/Zn/Cd) transporter